MLGPPLARTQLGRRQQSPLEDAERSCMARSPAHLQLFGLPSQREHAAIAVFWGQAGDSPRRNVHLLLACSETQREQVGMWGAGWHGRACHSIPSSQCGQSLPEALGRALWEVAPSLCHPSPCPFASNSWNLLKAETVLVGI